MRLLRKWCIRMLPKRALERAVLSACRGEKLTSGSPVVRRSCAFRMQGGKISHVYLLPDMHPVNEIFYGMISLYNRRKAMR